MQQYLDLLARVMDEGVDRDDRTGTGTRAVFGHQMRFDLADGFPLLAKSSTHVTVIPLCPRPQRINKMYSP